MIPMPGTGSCWQAIGDLRGVTDGDSGCSGEHYAAALIAIEGKRSCLLWRMRRLQLHVHVLCEAACIGALVLPAAWQACAQTRQQACRINSLTWLLLVVRAARSL